MLLRFSTSIVFFTVVLGHAQQATSTNRSAVISHARMRSLLHGMGVTFAEESSDDSTVFSFELNGHVITLLSQVKSMQLSACVEEHVEPMKANRWNQVHFFTRVELDQHGCAALRSDVGFAGGVTNEMIEAFISQFCTDVTIYARFVTPAAPPGTVAQPVERPRSPISTMAWSQVGQPTKATAPGSDAQSIPGLLKISRNISLKYDPELWKQTAPQNDGEFILQHSSGVGHALVIAERIAVPLASVEDIALSNAQAVDPNAKVVFRDRRRVNGADLHVLKIEANVDTVPMVYCGYFYAGENGTVQVVTSTPKTLLPEYEKEFMDFLNGFAISK